MENPQRSEEESKGIYFKNFRSIYPINDDMLDQMAKYSAFPQPERGGRVLCRYESG